MSNAFPYIVSANSTQADLDRVTVCGDDLLALSVDTPADAQRLAEALRPHGDFLEVVAGIDSVVVQFDNIATDLGDATVKLLALAENMGAAQVSTPTVIDIPIVYDGVDLDDVCAHLGMSRSEFIALHTRGEYTVDMLGFTPGFAYVGGFAAALDVPRLKAPRQRVSAGAVGIAGGRTGIYALPGPAGWPIVGHTALALFAPDADEPFTLSAGTTVRFHAEDTCES